MIRFFWIIVWEILSWGFYWLERTKLLKVPVPGRTTGNRRISLGFIAFILSVMVASAAVLTKEKAVTPLMFAELSAVHTLLFCAALTDAELKIIPNHLSLCMIGVRIICLLTEWITTGNVREDLLGAFIGLAVCFLILLLIGMLSKGGLGAGDVKILTSIGFMCGLETAMRIFLYALIVCAATSVLLIIAGKFTVKDHLPFGPFLWIGFIILLFIA